MAKKSTKATSKPTTSTPAKPKTGTSGGKKANASTAKAPLSFLRVEEKTKAPKPSAKNPAGPAAKTVEAQNAMLSEKHPLAGKRKSTARLPMGQIGNRGH